MKGTVRAIIGHHGDTEFPHVVLLQEVQSKKLLTLGSFKTVNNATRWARNVGPVVQAHLRAAADWDELGDALSEVIPAMPDDFDEYERTKEAA